MHVFPIVGTAARAGPRMSVPSRNTLPEFAGLVAYQTQGSTPPWPG